MMSLEAAEAQEPSLQEIEASSLVWNAHSVAGLLRAERVRAAVKYEKLRAFADHLGVQFGEAAGERDALKKQLAEKHAAWFEEAKENAESEQWEIKMVAENRELEAELAKVTKERDEAYQTVAALGAQKVMLQARVEKLKLGLHAAMQHVHIDRCYGNHAPHSDACEAIRALLAEVGP